MSGTMARRREDQKKARKQAAMAQVENKKEEKGNPMPDHGPKAKKTHQPKAGKKVAKKKVAKKKVAKKKSAKKKK